MSHLGTIIERVKRRALNCENDPDRLSADPLFSQSVTNLMEYMELWSDFTKDEESEAQRLFNLYREYADKHYCKYG